MPKPLPYLIRPATVRPPSITPKFSSNITSNILRTHLDTSTWILLGCLVQTILFLLPLPGRKSYAFLPTVGLLALRAINHVLILMGWKKNPHMEGVIFGKYAGVLPGNTDEKDAQPRDDKIAVLLLGAQTNHPNGVFNSTFSAMGKYMDAMNVKLEEEASTNGFLGTQSYIGTSDRTTNPALLNVFYFRSRQDVHDFAHGPVHREAWDWWNKIVKEGKDLQTSIWHELYEAPKGSWETVYGNVAPTGFGTTRHPVKDEKGQTLWVNPLVEAKGRFRTSNGRQFMTDGSDNEKYGDLW